MVMPECMHRDLLKSMRGHLPLGARVVIDAEVTEHFSLENAVEICSNHNDWQEIRDVLFSLGVNYYTDLVHLIPPAFVSSPKSRDWTSTEIDPYWCGMGLALFRIAHRIGGRVTPTSAKFEIELFKVLHELCVLSNRAKLPTGVARELEDAIKEYCYSEAGIRGGRILRVCKLLKQLEHTYKQEGQPAPSDYASVVIKTMFYAIMRTQDVMSLLHAAASQKVPKPPEDRH